MSSIDDKIKSLNIKLVMFDKISSVFVDKTNGLDLTSHW